MKSTVTYGARTWKFNKKLESKLMSMRMYVQGLKRIETMLLETKCIFKIRF